MLTEDPGVIILRQIRSVAVSLTEMYSAQDNPLLRQHLNWIDATLPKTQLTVEEELKSSSALFRLLQPQNEAR